jgi:hypothetical protein
MHDVPLTSLALHIMLTDTACSNLTYSIPHLEFLELAGIRTTLRDKGGIRGRPGSWGIWTEGMRNIFKSGRTSVTRRGW